MNNYVDKFKKTITDNINKLKNEEGYNKLKKWEWFYSQYNSDHEKQIGYVI